MGKRENSLCAQSKKGIPASQCNFKNVSCEQFHACLCGIPGIFKKIVLLKNMRGYNLYLIVCYVKSFLTYIRGLILPNARFVPANMVIPIAGLFMFTCTDTNGSDRGLMHSFLILSLVSDL